MLLERKKLIQAILQGDRASLENAVPTKMVDCYQIDGQDAFFRMDGTEMSPGEIKALERPKSFLTIRTYSSHDEVPLRSALG